MNFTSLDLIEPILAAIKSEGYETPTPIQLKAIPEILAGRDVLACAQTGTGKTAAFALPILQKLAANSPWLDPGFRGARPIRALVLTPTRELAAQISDSFRTYSQGLNLRGTTVYGGVSQFKQVQAIHRGVDVLVATPGRLLDLMNQKLVRFPSLEILVLDEADRMLDMGFINDINKIIASVPKTRQTLLFSATMPGSIRSLSEKILHQPVRIEVASAAPTADRVTQGVCFVEPKQKTGLLINILGTENIERALIFTRTKREANQVADSLNGANITAEAIHSNKSQRARERALNRMKAGDARVLVATDIASRGIDIDGITHVFNHDVPDTAESYVHRIGRTARAGAEGKALSLCARKELANLKNIESSIRKKLDVIAIPANFSAGSQPPPSSSSSRPGSQRPGRSQRRRFPQYAR